MERNRKAVDREDDGSSSVVDDNLLAKLISSAFPATHQKQLTFCDAIASGI